MIHDFIRKLVILGIALLFFSSGVIGGYHKSSPSPSVLLNSGSTLYVGGSEPGNYSSIQDAVDNATDGDMIYVYSGVYYENVLLDKNNVTLIGETTNTTIIDGRGLDVLSVYAPGFFISNFTITNGTGYNQHGIIVWDMSHVTIQGNLITGNNVGINVTASCLENLVYHNNFYLNTWNAYDYSLGINQNRWDNGYHSGGNYWSDYVGVDDDHNRRGDTPYNISGGTNQDRYPLMAPWGQIPPVADFTYEEDYLTVSFNTSESYDLDGTIIRHRWCFGDEPVYQEGPPIELLNHTYNEEGTYLVQFQVLDNDGLHNWRNETITVDAPNQPPLADFTFVIHDRLVSFNASSSSDIDGTITNYSWDFGDNTTGNGLVVDHQYSDYAAYLVRLHITDNEGEDGNCSKQVNLSDFIPPIIRNIQDYPDPQHCNGWVNISCLVTDNTAVSHVVLYEQHQELSLGFLTIGNMTYNPSTSVAYVNTTYSYPTVYTYWIIAYDENNNSNESDQYTFSIVNSPPNTPHSPSPMNGATNQSLTLNLSWISSDPDHDDSLSYDLYFGTTNQPIKITANITEVVYGLENLTYNTRYYWFVVAWDPHHASTTGPLWNFTTRLAPDVTPPTLLITNPRKGFLHVNIRDIIVFKFPFITTYVIGRVDITAEVTDAESGVEKVVFYVDDELQSTDTTSPYTWMWSQAVPLFPYVVKVTAFDSAGNQNTVSLKVWKFL